MTIDENNGLRDEDRDTAPDLMCQLNKIGYELGQMSDVHAMTDVTGFGLGGHLLEMCQGSGTAAVIDLSQVPKIKNVDIYLKEKQTPGGTHRNFASYGKHLAEMTDEEKAIVCDPQTSGGLLISVAESAIEQVRELLKAQGKHAEPIGRIVATESNEKTIRFGPF